MIFSWKLNEHLKNVAEFGWVLLLGNCDGGVIQLFVVVVVVVAAAAVRVVVAVAELAAQSWLLTAGWPGTTDNSAGDNILAAEQTPKPLADFRASQIFQLKLGELRLTLAVLFSIVCVCIWRVLKMFFLSFFWFGAYLLGKDGDVFVEGLWGTDVTPGHWGVTWSTCG
jgi:hypothetical protein